MRIIIILIMMPIFLFSQIEIPKSDNFLHYHEYSIGYSEQYKLAIWSAYAFTENECINNYKRQSTFHNDMRVENNATDSDYRGSGYDRGHLTPIANFRFEYDAMIETNFYANICPQTPSFNRGIWRRLENQVRRWVLEYDTLFIVSGPLLNENNKTIGNDLIVPEMYYKVIVFVKDGEYKSIAFLIPNKKSDIDIFKYQVTIDYIETLTGVDFFYKLPNNIENELELKNTLNE